MIYRRGYRSPRPSFRRSNFRSGFRRPLGRSKDRISRVQRAQFFLYGAFSMSSGAGFGTSANLAFELIKILDHLADFSTDSGVAMSGFTRSIDVSSIHFDYGWIHEVDYNSNQSFPANQPYVIRHTAMVVDRLDAAGAPVAVATTPWFTTQTPVAAIGAGLPAQTEREQIWPQRVLWERSELYDTTTRIITNTLEGELYVPTSPVYPSQRAGYVSKRVRARIGDQEGLYVVFSAARPNGALDAPATVQRFWAHGSLYYKVNF